MEFLATNARLRNSIRAFVASTYYKISTFSFASSPLQLTVII
jgi:hypothetical protein